MNFQSVFNVDYIKLYIVYIVMLLTSIANNPNFQSYNSIGYSCKWHYNDVVMDARVSQITNVTIV